MPDVALLNFLINLDAHLNDLAVRLGPWLYLVVFGSVFGETGFVVTPFLPSETLLFAGAALAAQPGSTINPWILAPVGFLATVAGDLSNYAIARRWGRSLMGGRIFTPAAVARAEAYFERFGGKTIFVARYLPVIRTVAPFLAGIGRMKWRTFLAYNVASAVVWVGLFVPAGYFLGDRPAVRENFGWGLVAIILVAVVPSFGSVLGSIFRRKSRNSA